METNDFAAQIEAGTKQIVEASGQKYEPTKLENLNIKSTNKNELQQLSSTLVGQINEGAKQAKEYNDWYEKEYGSKNQHVALNSVSL